MPSFEFADCPTRLNLTLDAGTQQQSGSVACTIRNTTARRQTARIRVEAQGAARPEWFAFAGAPATSPLEIEQDIDAGGTLTVTVAARVPPKTPPGSQTFRLRVTASETSTDTDFAEGPAIALDIAAVKEPEVRKPAFPWWAVVAAVLLLVIVGGAVGYLVWPRGLDPALVTGKPFSEAATIAAGKGFPDIKSQPGQAAGNDPARQIVVGVGKDASGATVLLIDPGVAVPDLARQQVVEATKTLINLGILPAQNAQFDSRSDMADGVVTRTIPAAPAVVALGGSVTLVLNNRPAGGGGGGAGPCIRLRDCLRGTYTTLDPSVFPRGIQQKLNQLPR